MRNVIAVYLRELKSYFVSPIFYILATVFMVVIGNSFKDTFFEFSTRTMHYLRMVTYGGKTPLIHVNDVASSMFGFIDFISLLIVPLLTMRIYAEEKKIGTIELLMTSPITTSQVLLGKFFSCLTVYTLMVIPTVAFTIILMIQSKGQLDWGPVLSGYLGTFLFGSALISIGIFYSALTENQIIAAAITITFIFGLWLVFLSSRFLSPPLNTFVAYLSLSNHINAFSRGLIEIKNIVYYLSMTIFWLFLSGITIESTRWRQ
jgi:ABC-2 type transport system permease protein